MFLRIHFKLFCILSADNMLTYALFLVKLTAHFMLSFADCQANSHL